MVIIGDREFCALAIRAACHGTDQQQNLDLGPNRALGDADRGWLDGGTCGYCLEAFDWQWAAEPKKFEWTVGDYVYVPPFTMHQHFSNPGTECRIIVMSNRIVKDMGFDWYDQVEHAPGF